MSERYEDPQGDEPTPEVYRRRRLIALVVLLLVILLLIWGIVSLFSALSGNNNKDQNAGDTASTSTSAEPFSDFTDRASKSASPSSSASASATSTAEASVTASATPSEEAAAESEAATESAAPTSAAAVETPAAEPTPTEAPVVNACTAGEMTVAVSTDKKTYAAGENPALAVTYTNTAGTPCAVGGEAPQIDVNITSGPAQVYNYAMCNKEQTPEQELAAGQSDTKMITWGRELNSLGCGKTRAIQPGYYWATATVNGVTSEPVRIIVTG